MTIETLELFGSDEQKQLLPSLRAYDKIGSWNYLGDKSKVDPEVASIAPVEGGYRLNGREAWALNGGISDAILLFAKHVETGKVIGVLLDSKAVGLTASAIKHKHSIRPASTANLYLHNVFVTEAALLPRVTVYKLEIEQLKAIAKFAVSAAGAGMMAGAYEVAAHYSRQRVQFNAPLAAFQLTQAKLVRMMAMFQTTYLQVVHFATSPHEPYLAANLEVYATTTGRDVVALAREIMGGNGITHEFLAMKHLLDMEAAHSLYDDVNASNALAGRKLLSLR
jgi:acyl-CoA oxidase